MDPTLKLYLLSWPKDFDTDKKAEKHASLSGKYTENK